MIIKKIMDIIEKKSKKKIYDNTFIIYKETFNTYSDIKFFHFAIVNNLSFLEKKKQEIIDLYVKSKNIINILNKFSKKMKF